MPRPYTELHLNDHTYYTIEYYAHWIRLSLFYCNLEYVV